MKLTQMPKLRVTKIKGFTVPPLRWVIAVL